jgi:preprotein translocase subunit SecY
VANPQAATLGKTGKFGDLWRRLWFLVGALVVYRIGAHIPVPGIDPVKARGAVPRASRAASSACSTCSRAARCRASPCSRWASCPTSGVDHHAADDLSPCPRSRQLKKEGEAGRRKITQYTRYGTRGSGHLFQGWASPSRSSAAGPGAGSGHRLFRFVTVLTLLTGTMFLMWLGEQITERGLGNGISIIIFAGIVAGLPSAHGGAVRTGAHRRHACMSALFICAVVVLVTLRFVVFVEAGQRKILVNYAKRQVGNKVYGGQSSHLPLKLNMSGVIPPIFARPSSCSRRRSPAGSAPARACAG